MAWSCYSSWPPCHDHAIFHDDHDMILPWSYHGEYESPWSCHVIAWSSCLTITINPGTAIDNVVRTRVELSVKWTDLSPGHGLDIEFDSRSNWIVDFGQNNETLASYIAADSNIPVLTHILDRQAQAQHKWKKIFPQCNYIYKKFHFYTLFKDLLCHQPC